MVAKTKVQQHSTQDACVIHNLTAHPANLVMAPRGAIFCAIIAGVFVQKLYVKLTIHQQPLDKANFKHMDFINPEV